MDNKGEGRSFCLLPDMAGQKGEETPLYSPEDKYQILFESNPYPMWVYDLETLRFLAVNNAAVNHYGYSREEFLNMTIKEIRPPQEIPLLMERLEKLLRTTAGFTSSGIWRHQRKGGTITDMEISSHSLTFKEKRARLVLANDVTERRQAEDALRIKTEQLSTVTTAMTAFLKSGDLRDASSIILRAALSQTGSEYGFIGVVADGPALRILSYEGMIWDKEANREFYNDAVHTYHETGYIEFTNLDNLFGRVITDGETVISNNPASDIRMGKRLPKGHPPLDSFLGVPILKGEAVLGIIGVANRPGGYSSDDQSRIETLSQAACLLYDSYMRHEKEIALERDRKQADEMVQYLAYYDVLTGLPNRKLFHDRLQQAIINAKTENRPLCLLILDLNRFKEINNTLGHYNGDIILQQIALRLQDTLKLDSESFKQRVESSVGRGRLHPALPVEGDGRSPVIARLGEDEFAIFLSGADAQASIKTADTIIKILEEPFVLEWLSLDVSASIGITLFPDHGEDADLLIRRADIAMHMAKKIESGYCIYSPRYDQHSPERLALMGELRHAIMQNQLFLLYQPKVDIKISKPIGVEALVRWQHPKSGIIPPDKFISLAEHTGLIKQLTFWVLKEALRQSRVLHQIGIETSVAVNLSVRSLQSPQLLDQIKGLLSAWGVESRRLRFEITESIIMADPERAMEIITQLSSMGIHFSIDDFGTGYSSLSYLQKLPVDEIKVDKSFVMNMMKDKNSMNIVRSIIELGHNLGLKIVAEGVESLEILNCLADLGCDSAQGYYVSRPIPAPELIRWLKEQPSINLSNNLLNGNPI